VSDTRDTSYEEDLEQLLAITKKAIDDNITNIFSPTKYSLENALMSVVTVLITAAIGPLNSMCNIDNIATVKRMLLRLIVEMDKILSALSAEKQNINDWKGSDTSWN
jgi:hypothetical protein